MNNFKNNPIRDYPSKEKLLRCISDEDIFYHYIGGIPKKPIKSPLRNDQIPSFHIFYSKNLKMFLFNDFATGEKGDAFIFVKRLFGYSTVKEACLRIAADFSLDQFYTLSTISANQFKQYVGRSNSYKKGTSKKASTKEVDLKITTRPWKIRDKNYWFDKYGLTKKQLEYCRVVPISHFFINGFTIVADELAYAFVENKDGVQTYKIYQPLNEENNKWINNNDFSTWELWSQLPYKGKRLIITSSRKDAMVIKSLFNTNVLTACALQSEKVNPKESVMDELKLRFNEIYVLYDNDKDKDKNWGQISSDKICNQFGVLGLKIPDEYDEKDISDFREAHGDEKTRELIINLIKDKSKLKKRKQLKI